MQGDSPSYPFDKAVATNGSPVAAKDWTTMSVNQSLASWSFRHQTAAATLGATNEDER